MVTIFYLDKLFRGFDLHLQNFFSGSRLYLIDHGFGLVDIVFSANDS